MQKTNSSKRKSAHKKRVNNAGKGIQFEPLETRQLMAAINVTDFGARPNDNADDLGAIRAAINASRPGDTIVFNGGVFNLSDEITVPGDRTYKGTNGATLKGRGGHGQLVTLHENNVTFTGLTFENGGVFIDKSGGGFNQNITFDYNIFKLNTGGEHPSAITFTSGLQNSKITNNYFTNPAGSGGFGIYGYNYNGLTIANNEFVNIAAGMHIDAFSNSGNLLVEQNYMSGLKGMGMEFQSSASNLTFQDNWYENPNLSTTFNANNNSMAYSLILDKSSNITIRRNVVIAPQRPDGVGTRIGFEVGGDNSLVEDNYINGVNHVLAVNDGVGSASVTVRNNKWLNYLQGATNSFPAGNRTWQNINNGPGTRLSDTMESRIAASAKPGIGSKRYGGGVSTPPPVVNGNPNPAPTPEPAPAPSTTPTGPTGLAVIVTGPTKVNLFWSDRSSNETGYRVERSTDGENWTEIVQLGANQVSFTAGGLTAGQKYSFRVRAINANGTSDYSNVASATPSAFDPALGMFLSDLPYVSAKNTWGPAERDRSNGEINSADGEIITIGGKQYAKGLGVHSGSEVRFRLDGKYATFQSDIGIDAETSGNGTVVFEVWGDGKRLYTSGTVTGQDAPKSVTVNVAGVKELSLIVNNADGSNDFDHANWANARVVAARRPAPTPAPTDGSIYVSDLEFTSYSNGWGVPELDRSSGDRATGDGKTITLNGTTYAKGIGAHSTGDIRYNLDGKYSTFTSSIGIDDEVGDNGSVVFQVFADGKKVYDSGVMTGASATKTIEVDVEGKRELWLVVTSAGDNRDFDHADWANAKLIVNPNATSNAVYLNQLTPTAQTNGWGPIEMNTSVGEIPGFDGRAMQLNRRTYSNGVGVHSESKLVYDLNGQYKLFTTDLGIDDEVGNQGSVTFEVWADGEKVYDSGLLTGADSIRRAQINVEGKNQLWLVVTDGGDGTQFDHADWANARLFA